MLNIHPDFGDRAVDRSRNNTSTMSAILAVCLAWAATLPGAVVQWATDADGFWHTAANWTSSPSLPGPADDVTIDRPLADIIVTHSQGTDSIKSLTCNEALTVSGGVLSLANASQIGGPFTVSGGTLNATTSGTGANFSGSVVFSGGTLGGVGTLTFSDLTWTGGTNSSRGGLVIGAGGTLAISGSAAKTFGMLTTQTAQLINHGTATLSDMGSIFHQAGPSGDTWANATLTNAAEGTFAIESDAGFVRTGLFGTSAIDNAGLFKKSGGTGTSSIGWTVNNSGTVRVESGTLGISGAFNNTGTVEVQDGRTLTLSGGGTGTGNLRVGVGATLNFSGGTHSLATSTLTNDGTTNFSL
jgi:hypothetical protein